MGNKKRSQKISDAPVRCAFQKAIECTEEVKDGFRYGKQAIKNSDRGKIEVADNKKFQGSLDIDTQVKKLYPQAPRWDYAVSYADTLYFVEVHPAETSEVDKVVSKVRWLREWLCEKATEIDKLPKASHPYIWIPSGRYAILPNSKEMRRLSAAGLTVINKLVIKYQLVNPLQI